MRRLDLLRHAKAEPDNEAGDHERPLSSRGRKDAAAMGREIARRGFVPSLVLCSTARRTAETIELVLPFLIPAPEVKLEPILYHAQPDDIWKRVALIGAAHESVLIVGHNPSLHHLAFILAGSGKRARRIAEKFPTSAFASFASNEASWNAAAGGNWELRDEFRPADF